MQPLKIEQPLLAAATLTIIFKVNLRVTIENSHVLKRWSVNEILLTGLLDFNTTNLTR